MSPARLFTEVNQIYYYVPFTQLAVIVPCVQYLKSNETVEKLLLKKTSIFGILGIIMTAIIVTQLNVELYFGNLEQYRGQLLMLSFIWLINNAIRLVFIDSSLRYTFQVYVYRQVSSGNFKNSKLDKFILNELVYNVLL